MGVGIAGNNVTFSIYSSKNALHNGVGTTTLFTIPAGGYAEMQVYTNAGAGKIEASDTLVQIVAPAATGTYIIGSTSGCNVQAINEVTVTYSAIVWHNS